MLTAYIRTAMARAELKPRPDGTYYADIPGVQGVWACAASPEETISELQEVLEDWIMLRLERHLPIPDLDGISLNQSSRVA